MVGWHFPQKGDPVPIGGVQDHIERVTAHLRFRGHQVEWVYRENEERFRSLLSWADRIVCHDYFSFKQAAGVPTLTIFHGWEGKWPVDSGVIRARQQVKAASAWTINAGAFIEKFYGTPADAVIWGGSEPVQPVMIPAPVQNRALYLGRLDPDTCPEPAFRLSKMMGWALEVCGDGSLRRALQQEYPQAYFHGFVKDLSSHINRAEFVIGTGYLSYLAAMARRRPVISFWENPLRQFYVESFPGRILSGRRPEDVYWQLLALEDEEFSDIVEENAAIAARNTWADIADVYEKLMKGEKQCSG